MKTWKAMAYAGFALFLAAGCIQEPDYSKKIGEKGVLTSSADYTQVAVDEAAFDELVKSRAAGDKAGIMDLVVRKRLFYVKNGAQVLVIDSSFAKRKIRILEGEHGGMTGWVAVERVK